MIDINEGRTNIYLVHGVFTLIAGAILTYYHVLLCLPFILVAIALFLSSNGLLISPENKQYKQYTTILGVKYGTWKSLGKVINVNLVLRIERAKTNQSYILGDRGFSKSTTYDISFTSESGKGQLIYEFLKYRHAKQALDEIHEKMKIPVFDKVSEKIIQNRRYNRR